MLIKLLKKNKNIILEKGKKKYKKLDSLNLFKNFLLVSFKGLTK